MTWVWKLKGPADIGAAPSGVSSPAIEDIEERLLNGSWSGDKVKGRRSSRSSAVVASGGAKGGGDAPGVWRSGTSESIMVLVLVLRLASGLDFTWRCGVGEPEPGGICGPLAGHVRTSSHNCVGTELSC